MSLNEIQKIKTAIMDAVKDNECNLNDLMKLLNPITEYVENPICHSSHP
jgi:hypothetical protein